MKATVHLGFEVGTGEPVSIPLRHLVITGQTQEAGKTTTLEALVARSAVNAVAFITKRGEGSFTDARIIRPYFRERADWQFVAAILEASRSEKMRFERSWIIKASRGAKSLADVQRNVRKLMESAKRGMDQDMYLVLDAYLEDVVPQITQVRWASRVDLGPGINVMDLTTLNSEMQQLVIRSTIEWIHENADQTVVVVPEAWKFIPEGRGSPVKLAADTYIRQGAGIKNYLWLDSQDIAGVDKKILKSVPVWILGVQRESNEVKRTLAQIPGGIKKPKPEAVQTLGLGEFYVCYGSHITKVYAQPAWIGEAEAQAIARGETPFKPIHRPRPRSEVEVTEQEARELREENAHLRQRIAELERLVTTAPSSNDTAAASAPQSGRQASGDSGSTPDGATTRAGGSRRAVARPPQIHEELVGEDLYQAIKRRLTAEAPALLKVLAIKPELEVHVERRVIEGSGSTLFGRLAQLIAEGYFDEPKAGNAAYQELQRRGFSTAKPNVYREADKLALQGFLTKEDGGYRAVSGMKVNIVETASAYD